MAVRQKDSMKTSIDQPGRRVARAGRTAGPIRAACALVLFGLAAAAQGALTTDPLVEAARGNDAARVQTLLAGDGDVNARSADGTTALHWAVHNDNERLVEQLIAAGADVNARNDYGSTPMSEAAVLGNAALIRRLLAAGADPESPNPDGQTALMIVARTSQVEAARVLIEHGADVNRAEQWRGQTALMWAAAQNQPEMVSLLLEHGADPNARSTVNEWQRQVSGETRRMFRPSGGLTPLLLAAREGCAACVPRLVAGGADPNLGDPDNVVPLFVAIDNTNFDTARALLGAGADPNRWDWYGRTALYGAADMVTVPAGGWPDLPTTDETTPIEMIRLLLDAGANPDLQLKMFPPYRSIVDDRGCDNMLTTGTTPLLRLAKTFDAEAMQLLIERGANLELPNSSGIRPLMAAAGLGSMECDPRGYGPGIPHYQTPDVQEASIRALAVLIDAGADINARTFEDRGQARNRGQTALHGAAFWGWSNVARYLIERGAQIDIQDAAGRTPYDAALGRAGGHGRGQTIEVFDDTAELLVRLCREQPACDLDRMTGGESR
jgi:uncharacterized protein